MVKTIFFDIGGVILNIYPDRTIDYLHDCTKLHPDILRKAFSEDLHNRYEKGFFSDEEFFLGFKNNLPQPNCLNKDDFFKAWLELLGEPTETMKLAEKLNTNYPVWLLSNTNPYHIEYLEKNGLLKGVTGRFYSFDFGVRKPDRDFFEAALAFSRAKAENSLFIDDKIENVMAARKLGFHTIHYKSNSQFVMQLSKILPTI